MPATVPGSALGPTGSSRWYGVTTTPPSLPLTVFVSASPRLVCACGLAFLYLLNSIYHDRSSSGPWPDFFFSSITPLFTTSLPAPAFPPQSPPHLFSPSPFCYAVGSLVASLPPPLLVKLYAWRRHSPRSTVFIVRDPRADGGDPVPCALSGYNGRRRTEARALANIFASPGSTQAAAICPAVIETTPAAEQGSCELKCLAHSGLFKYGGYSAGPSFARPRRRRLFETIFS